MGRTMTVEGCWVISGLPEGRGGGRVKQPPGSATKDVGRLLIQQRGAERAVPSLIAAPSAVHGFIQLLPSSIIERCRSVLHSLPFPPSLPPFPPSSPSFLFSCLDPFLSAVFFLFASLLSFLLTLSSLKIYKINSKAKNEPRFSLI